MNKGATARIRTSARFFFQAEDGIRPRTVTGVQTCALPISQGTLGRAHDARRHRERNAARAFSPDWLRRQRQVSARRGARTPPRAELPRARALVSDRRLDRKSVV